MSDTKAEAVLKAIIKKGQDYLHGAICGDCFETECDPDCPVLLAHNYFGTVRVDEAAPEERADAFVDEKPPSTFMKLTRAEADLKEAVALLKSQHHCYRVELGSPSVVCIPCDFLARISAEDERRGNDKG